MKNLLFLVEIWKSKIMAPTIFLDMKIVQTNGGFLNKGFFSFEHIDG
jgi:hypothetical protein